MTPTTNEQQGAADFDRLLTLPEVGRLLRVSKWTLYRMINAGQLKTVTVRRRRLVAPADYAALIDVLRSEQAHGIR